MIFYGNLGNKCWYPKGCPQRILMDLYQNNLNHAQRRMHLFRKKKKNLWLTIHYTLQNECCSYSWESTQLLRDLLQSKQLHPKVIESMKGQEAGAIRLWWLLHTDTDFNSHPCVNHILRTQKTGCGSQALSQYNKKQHIEGRKVSCCIILPQTAKLVNLLLLRGEGNKDCV